MPRITLPWVEELPLRMQSVLLLGLRGCDSAPKGDFSKPLVRYLRWCSIQNSHDPEHFKFGSFMQPRQPDWNEVEALFQSTDHYPVHWLTHFLHAAQIVGAKIPDIEARTFWRRVYVEGVRALHFEPEHYRDFEIRLGPGENG